MLRNVRTLSLPQRIRAGCDDVATALGYKDSVFATAHSCGLRLDIAANVLNGQPLPQRIRAGCDSDSSVVVHTCALCHSAFVRVATKAKILEIAFEILCHSAFVRVATAEKQCSALRICCEKVDSFSSVGESGLALTIFPFSFAAKATYVAINDSFGRAIDRFFGANRTGISVNYDFAEHPCL